MKGVTHIIYGELFLFPFRRLTLLTESILRRRRIKTSFSPLTGEISFGREDKYSFNWLKDSSASLVHSNFLCLRVLKKGKHLSADLDINLPKAATHPVSFWTSFTEVGDFISRIARILSGFSSIPLSSTRKPRHFPPVTPNTHLSGLSRIWWFRKIMNVSHKSAACSDVCLFLVIISSTYISKFRPIWDWKTKHIINQITLKINTTKLIQFHHRT